MSLQRIRRAVPGFGVLLLTGITLASAGCALNRMQKDPFLQEKQAAEEFSCGENFPGAMPSTNRSPRQAQSRGEQGAASLH